MTDLTGITPMMQQYVDIKNQYEDCILLYRLGDFYEMFFDDAIVGARELELALTGKNCGLEERAPMCGVPHHALEPYLAKLVAKGYKVAICEQVEDARLAKGIVRREVIRIATPGTNLSTGSLDETRNNYLMGIFYEDGQAGISIADVTTGDYAVTQVNDLRRIMDEIHKVSPSEILCNPAFLISGIDVNELRDRYGIAIGTAPDHYYDADRCEDVLLKHFKKDTLEELLFHSKKDSSKGLPTDSKRDSSKGLPTDSRKDPSKGLSLDSFALGIYAAGMVLIYLQETQKNNLGHITEIRPYVINTYMIMDNFTRRNLEITETMRDKGRKGSFLWVLDKTKTAMGARMLRHYIEQPLIDANDIEDRLSAIEEINNYVITREEIREYLRSIYDIERLISKISYANANPRDLIAFRNSLNMLPHIKKLCNDYESGLLVDLTQRIDVLDDIHDLIRRFVEEEPPIGVRDGGIIREGYNPEADRLRLAKTEGKNWLVGLEAKERDATGIKNLRIKYNRVFGYYFEVTNSYASLVPEHWVRKQTLSNAERYTSKELKELEDTILNAEDMLFGLEYELFVEIRERIAGEVVRVQNTAKAIATLDVLTTLAYVAEKNNYTRPHINADGVIEIKDGRHPVVELTLSNGMFIGNDTRLDNDRHLVSIITGPNMAGKSTYMRQIALITLMAQMGSFVPAAKANISIVDRIFTRVGASDDVASGQSTFMVEMTEVANILKYATSKSLIILDEIGRGTSTFDGLAIAWAVVEHISDRRLLGAKTLFATHYHELTELEGRIDGVNNYCIAVKEQGEDVVFLRKIISGGADKSYGIQVAKLAGVPERVLARAREIADGLSGNELSKVIFAGDGGPCTFQEALTTENDGEVVQDPVFVKIKRKYGRVNDNAQMSIFGSYDYESIIHEIRNMDISELKPLEALNKLDELQKRLRESI